MFGNCLRYTRANPCKSANLLSLECLKRLLDFARIGFLYGLLKLTIKILQALSQLNVDLLELIYLLTTLIRFYFAYSFSSFSFLTTYLLTFTLLS
jgi:hypothetical protein